MNALSLLEWWPFGPVATSVLIIVFLIIVLNYIFSARVSLEEYLPLIPTTEWRSGRDIRKEMISRKRGTISGPRFYQHMARLEDSGLIVCKDITSAHGCDLRHFKRTMAEDDAVQKS